MSSVELSFPVRAASWGQRLVAVGSEVGHLLP